MNTVKIFPILTIGIIMVLSSLAGCNNEPARTEKSSAETELSIDSSLSGETEENVFENEAESTEKEPVTATIETTVNEPKTPSIPPSEEATDTPTEESEQVVTETVEFVLTSVSFEDGAPIPARHSYHDGNKSPELDWMGKPEGTVSFALLVDDPDGGNWSHWVLFNLGADIEGLGEDQPTFEELGNGVKQGRNDFGEPGWGGPSPPSGTHRYYFRLYALDTMLDLPAGATLSQVKAAMEGHILDTAELMGTYSA